MRTIKYIAACAVALLFASCTKYLEEKPVSSIGLDDINDAKTLNILLMGVYGCLQDCYAPNCMAVGEAGTDVTFTSKANVNYQPVDRYALTSSTGPTSNYWKSHFTVVKNANVVIDKATELATAGLITSADSISIVSQARFLRGWAYFKLMEAFGELPIIDHSIKVITQSEYGYPRRSIADVFHFIESDFQFGIDSGGLPDVKDGGRVTLWAAKFFLAKLYLYVGSSKQRNLVGTPDGGIMYDGFASNPAKFQPTPIPGGTFDLIPGYDDIPESYTDLYAQSNMILGEFISSNKFSLMDNYYDPVAVQNKNTNSESIWEIQFSTDVGMGSSWSKLFGVRSDGPNTDYNWSAVSGQLQLQPVPSFWKYYKKGDRRQGTNITNFQVIYGNNAQPAIPAPPKPFAYSYTYPFRNPYNNQAFTQAIAIDLDSESPLILEASYLQSALSLQIGTQKYTWGTSSDPAVNLYQTMSYASTNCPNNVVAARYADVLLMFAETEMLLNGASPAQPRATGFATNNVVNIANQLLNRGTGLKTAAEYQALLDSYIATETTALTAAIADTVAKHNTYYASATSQNNNANWGTLQYSRAKYQSIFNILEKLQTPGTDMYVAQPYDVNTFTYEMLIDERARELCFEFQRWFDLQRLGWLKYKVLQRKMNYDPAFPLPPIVEPKHYLYPIPFMDSDLATDPSFKKNNPGY